MDTNQARSVQTRALTVLREEFEGEFEILSAGGKIGSLSSLFKFEFKSVNKEEVKSAEYEQFKTYAQYVGLLPDDFEREFLVQGYIYKIVAVLPNRSKFPIVGERADGKRFKFTVPTVKGVLGRK